MNTYTRSHIPMHSRVFKLSHEYPQTQIDLINQIKSPLSSFEFRDASIRRARSLGKEFEIRLFHYLRDAGGNVSPRLALAPKRERFVCVRIRRYAFGIVTQRSTF